MRRWISELSHYVLDDSNLSHAALQASQIVVFTTGINIKLKL